MECLWRFDSCPDHHSFISTLRRRQVAEKWCRCGGSIESISVVRDSFGEEQLLECSVDHDDWFRAEIEKGSAAAREGRPVEDDDVAARIDRRYRG